MPQSKTIFLIDDDEDDCDVFRFALETLRAPVSLVRAFDGVNALEQMAMPDFVLPHLIMLDLNMPRMNGWQLLTRLRERSDYRGVPTVVYSTSSAPADINGAMALGATAFMTKHHSIARMCDDLKILLTEHGLFSSVPA